MSITKARKSAKKTTKKAAKRAEKRAAHASEVVHDRAADLADLAERAGVVAQERAHDLAERLRDSDAIARAQARGGELAGLAGAKGADLADLAKAKWHDADLDKRTAALAKQIREAEATKEASRRARDLTDSSLAAVGGWLAGGTAAEKMGVVRKPKIAGWVWALIGAAAGFAAAKLLASQTGEHLRDDLVAAADRLADSTSHPAGTVLADTIRTTLEGDPRTADLRQININVAEGTVFVRGSLPSGIDQQAVRDVIERVPGVEDVDLQLTPAV